MGNWFIISFYLTKIAETMEVIVFIFHAVGVPYVNLC